MSAHNRFTQNKIIMFAILVLFATTNYAQQERRQHRLSVPPDSAQINNIVEKLSQTLSLSEEQKTAVSETHFAQFQQVKELRKKYQESRENERGEMETLRKEFKAELNNILTEDQKIQFEKFKKDHKPERKRRGGRHN